MNQLQYEKSPYLLSHADNPVDWLPWGQRAFDRARAEDKPVFLSIGYAACHWCHVMARESFADREAAAVINRGFVAVKVDREERPDVDGAYMDACLTMNGSGGWPLTVLLTPEGQPFWAGTYLPKPRLMALLEQFFDGERGGVYPYASDGEQLITRNKETYDGAMPSANSVAALE